MQLMGLGTIYAHFCSIWVSKLTMSVNILFREGKYCSLLYCFSTDFNSSALARVVDPREDFEEDWDESIDHISNTLLTLINAYEDLSFSHIMDFFSRYQGPWEPAERSLDHVSRRGELDEREVTAITYQMLQHAVSQFGRGEFVFGDTIRALIRRGVNLHWPILECDVPWFFLSASAAIDYGTAFDVLIQPAQTPSMANDICTAWLDLLSSEGIDLVAYLEWEIRLHDGHNMIFYPSNCGEHHEFKYLCDPSECHWKVVDILPHDDTKLFWRWGITTDSRI